VSHKAEPIIASLAPALARQVDQICNRFEAAWRNGERPKMEAFLAEAPEEAKAALGDELARLDSYYRGEGESGLRRIVSEAVAAVTVRGGG
jgi:hypothetical protein